MTRLFSFCLLLLYLVSPQSEAQAQTPLKIVARELTPLAWQEDGQAHGIVFDLVQAIQSELDVSYPTQFLPFKRGIYLTQNNPDTSLLPVCAPRSATKFKMGWSSSQVPWRFYQLANRPQVKSLRSICAMSGLVRCQQFHDDTSSPGPARTCVAAILAMMPCAYWICSVSMALSWWTPHSRH